MTIIPVSRIGLLFQYSTGICNWSVYKWKKSICRFIKHQRWGIIHSYAMFRRKRAVYGLNDLAQYLLNNKQYSDIPLLNWVNAGLSGIIIFSSSSNPLSMVELHLRGDWSIFCPAQDGLAPLIRMWIIHDLCLKSMPRISLACLIHNTSPLCLAMVCWSRWSIN